MYIPFPGPPAENDPPPPIKEFNTANAKKSLSLYEELSSDNMTCVKSGSLLGPIIGAPRRGT